MQIRVYLTAALFLATGCASDWKIHGGPKECVAMCQGWNMELAGMVGVGNQDRTGNGATACVCHVPTGNKVAGAEVVAPSVAGPVTAAEAAAAAQLAQQQALQTQQQHAPGK